MPKERIILTDNTAEKIEAFWDGERFAIRHYAKDRFYEQCIILNPKEAYSLKEFLELYLTMKTYDLE